MNYELRVTNYELSKANRKGIIMETNYDAVKALVAAVSAGLKGDGCWSGPVMPEVYHAAKGEVERKLRCPVVSKSLLWDFMKDPYGARWRAMEGVKKESDALRKGSLIDCLTLTPELFGGLYVVEEVNRRTNAGKARVAELEGEGKVILTPKEFDEAQKVALLARGVLESLGGYRTQVACWARVDEVGGEALACPVVITGMFDVLPDEVVLPVVDLKTTSRSIVDEREVCRNVAEFGYGIQAAVYTDLCQLVLGQERGFRFLYVSTEEPVRLRWVGVDSCDVEMYRARYYAALREYARCWKEDYWGDAVLPAMVYAPPVWDVNRGSIYGPGVEG